MEVLKVFIAILPVFIFGLYVYMHDKEKEPTSLLFVSFLAGILICIPCIYVERTIANHLGALQANVIGCFLYVLLSIALVEEGYKFLASFIIAYDNKENDYTFDSIVYCTFTALGFAFFENMIYFNSVSLSSMTLRAFTAVPVHLSCGIIMGYFLSKAKQNRDDEKINLFYALIIPVAIHGFYNYYLIYIANKIRLYFSMATSVAVIYTLLILMLTVLFLGCYFLLEDSSINDRKIKRYK